MRYLVLRGIAFSFLVSIVSACSGSDDSRLSASNCGAIDASDVTVSQSGSVLVSPKNNLNITGSVTTVTVSTGSEVANLNIIGSSNLVTIADNVTVDYVCISGDDNTLDVPDGSGIIVNKNTGRGNSVI